MAGGIKAYTFLRKLHLYCAFILLGFLLMYFITGWIMTHHDWFEHPGPIEETSVHIRNLPKKLSPEEYALFIQEEFKLYGQRKEQRLQKNGEIYLRYIRPGTEYKVIIDQEKSSVKISTYLHDRHRTMVLFHRIEEYGGGWIYDIYVCMMDLSGIALILFSVTGLYFWLKLVRNKWLGLSFMLLGLIFSISVALLLSQG